ncbi:hypothetical protein L195_g041712, partial [Trifolium pratense]
MTSSGSNILLIAVMEIEQLFSLPSSASITTKSTNDCEAAAALNGQNPSIIPAATNCISEDRSIALP